MDRTWTVFEKILAVVQILLALAVAFMMYSYIMTDEETGITAAISDFRFSHYDLVEYRTMYSVVILLLSGSLLLLYNKKAGWVISIIVWLFWLFWLLIVYYYGNYSGTSPWLLALFPISCFGVIIFLTQKHFLIKYSLSKSYGLIVLAGVILLLADYDWKQTIGIGWHSLF